MKKAILYIHGKGGNALEAERYRESWPDFTVTGVDYRGEFPWPAGEDIRRAYDLLQKEHTRITVLANSIGAYFAMHALEDREVEKALFISPILDMERLILDMMSWAHVTERELREKGEIPTEFGETLSWSYLRFVREHPIRWKPHTEILYGDGDHLTSRETVEAFLKTHDAALTVMKGGEHWFHTEAQLAFLDDWMRKAL